jgi:hypothetical protein
MYLLFQTVAASGFCFFVGCAGAQSFCSLSQQELQSERVYCACALFAAQASTGVVSEAVTLQQLLDAVPCTAVDFFEPFKRFCRALGLQTSILDLVLLLERKYVVSHLLFRKYEKLFALHRQRTESFAFHFGWLLFLVAKSRVLRSVVCCLQRVALIAPSQ